MRKKIIPFIVSLVFTLIFLVLLCLSISIYINWINKQYFELLGTPNSLYLSFLIISSWLLLFSIIINVCLYRSYKDKKEKMSNEETNSPSGEVSTSQGFIKYINVFLNSIKKSKVLAIIVLIIMTLNAAFLIIVFSISTCVNDDANVTSRLLNGANEYMVTIGKYEENKYSGTTLLENGVLESDLTSIKERFGDKAVIYKKYVYNTKFNDILDPDRTYNTGEHKKITDTFKKICFIDDFSTFNQPLLKGEMPKNDNEVLIYDYIENSFLEAGMLKDAILGLEFYDSINNIKFKVSGIIKSNYNIRTTLDRMGQNYFDDLSTVYCTSNSSLAKLNYQFEGYYISLSKDWGFNQQILAKASWPYRSDDFYNNLEIGEEAKDYVVYSTFLGTGVLSRYQIVHITAKNITLYSIFSVFTSILVILSLIFMLNSFHLDCLKNTKKYIITGNILTVLAMLFISFGLSIPLSIFILFRLSNDLNSIGTLFYVGSNYLFVITGIGVLFAILTSIIICGIGIALSKLLEKRRRYDGR